MSEDKRQSRKRKKALSIFSEPGRARRRAKKAFADMRLTKPELRSIIKGGATKKQVRNLAKTIGKTPGLKSRFLRRGGPIVRKTATDIYDRIQTKRPEREDEPIDIKDTIDESKTAVDEGASGLEDLFSGQLDMLISGQTEFKQDLMDMFSNMMAIGQSRSGALGVRSARRGRDGQTGMTSQFGREGLRIRSLNI